MQRPCDSCGLSYEAKTKRSRFCGERCRKRGQRAGTLVSLEGGGEVSAETSTRRVLTEAGRLESPAGVNALLLARKLDAGGDTGSAMVALSKQHLAVLEAALEGVKVAASPLDELRQRREARLRGA